MLHNRFTKIRHFSKVKHFNQLNPVLANLTQARSIIELSSETDASADLIVKQFTVSARAPQNKAVFAGYMVFKINTTKPISNGEINLDSELGLIVRLPCPLLLSQWTVKNSFDAVE
ncbi:hypothetical protein OK016_29810 [Vibrio chagasii]|nr:hypothetical protein [Vibrio chagasii]